METTPVDLPSTLRGAEELAQTILSQFRVLSIPLEEQWQQRLAVDHQVFGWLVAYASWSCTHLPVLRGKQLTRSEAMRICRNMAYLLGGG